MLMTPTKHSAHPIANIFPLMTREQTERLAEEIIVDGQREPIVLFGHLIVDGRNRECACQMLGIAPAVIPFTGAEDDILPYVVKVNLARRDLSLEQRAMIAARVVNTGHSYFASTWKPGPASLTTYVVTCGAAAKMFGVHRSSVNKAKMVLEKATPEVIAAVEQGKMSINRAYGSTIPAERRPVPPPKKSDAERAEAQRYKSNIFAHLRTGIDELTSLPQPADVAAIARALDRSDLISRKLPLALKWLQEFATCLSPSSKS